MQLTLLVESMMRAVSPVAKVAPGQGCPWKNLDNHEITRKDGWNMSWESLDNNGHLMIKRDPLIYTYRKEE